MAEIITCPACSRKLQVPESFYGQKVQCPECAQMFVAEPHATSVQSTPPAAPPTKPVPEYDDSPRRSRDIAYEDDDFDDDFERMRPLRRSGVPHRGGMILALGIISLVIFPYATIVCGPLAWILGNTDMAEIRVGRMDQSGEGMVQAGRVLGMVSTILLLASVLIFCFFFGIIFVGNRR